METVIDPSHDAEAPAPQAYWNPYAAGVALGGVLLGAFVVFGRGLGASGAMTRSVARLTHVVAPRWVDANGHLGGYFAHGGKWWDDWLIFEVVGVALGGLAAAITARRLRVGVDRGPNITDRVRVLAAFAGGAVVGFGARLAQGCTSGQALTGGATMALGSWAFMFAVFGGALRARLVRSEVVDMIPLHPATFVAYTLAVLTGFAFGFVLERAGFGSARKLAAQFYLTDMRVLKVMFTAIVTAMLGLTLLRAAGLVNYDAIWVNPTFLGAQVVGGLLFGAGFVIGGYCPGTAVVAMVSGRLDALAFLLGAGVGILGYAGVYHRLAGFAQRGGARTMLTDWLHLPYGVVALGVTLLALGFFAGGEYLERRFGEGKTS